MIRISTKSKEMDETHNAYSLENEREGMDIHLGVEGSNSNGHEKEIYKEGNMRKIIEKLQKYAQTHRVDKKKLRKAQEKQGEFNIKMLRSLERIENKLEKESDSSRIGSRQTSEGRRSQSVGRHHHHSQGHSKRRAHSGSSLSPTRKHRGSRVDELKGEMNKINPPTFYGEHKEEDFETWLLGMRKYFQL